MPYDKLSELPDSVKDNLPKHAEEIYRAAYNSAWDEYADAEIGAVMHHTKRQRIGLRGQQ